MYIWLVKSTVYADLDVYAYFYDVGNLFVGPSGNAV